MSKKTKNNLKERMDVKSYKISDIKRILWRLCYEPEEMLVELKMDDLDSNVVIEGILQLCVEEGINLLFGGEVPCVDTLGVDLGIKNPVVRDVILGKVYNHIEKDHGQVEKAIKLFKTENSGSELAIRRIIGGLRAIGFSYEEANYLFDTCDLYPISLLLVKLLEKKEAKETELKEFETVAVETSTRNSDIKTVVANPYLSNVKASENSSKASVLIANKENVEKFFELAQGINSKSELENTLESLKKELKRLEEVMFLVENLEKEGLSFDELKTKEEKLKNLFGALAAL